MQLFLRQQVFEPIRPGSVISSNSSNSMEQTFLSEMYRVLETNVDYALDPNAELLFRNPMIQRFLSMQVSLSYAGEEKHRSLPAKLAWTILNLRFISMCFTIVLSRKLIGPPGTENEFKKPGTSRNFCSVNHVLIYMQNPFGRCLAYVPGT